MAESGGPATRRTPSRWVIATILVAHTLAGVAGGMALEHYILHRHRPMFFGLERGGRMGMGGSDTLAARQEMQHRMADHLARELDLDAAQRSRLDSMMPAQAARFEALRREMEPRLRALLDSSSVQIEAILRPDQVAHWQEIRRRMVPDGGPPGP